MKKLFLFGLSTAVLIVGIFLFWLGNIKVPDFRSFNEREIENSTKIYDRTGEVLLYGVSENIRRTTVLFSEMGSYIKNATVAVEDADFYKHRGVRLISFLRASLVNLLSGEFSQGGSTITQQVVKNTLLTPEKTIARKLKEWILSLKIDSTFPKEKILEIYLNESPYGGMLYGVAEAANSYFGKKPNELSLAEAAYLAALPKAPTYYSPYGGHKDKLDERKNFVLSRMLELGFITSSEFEQAKNEEVVFKPQEKFGIRAPHFVFYVRDYLENRYGKNLVDRGGLKVITSLDYPMQEKAEEIVLKYAKENEVKFKGKNAALVAMDPKTGQILSMVGSRDYFDKEIDGNYNVTTALRQPGSAFKPFVYATLFKKGFLPETVLFDVPTEFQTTCDPDGKALPGYNQNDCYMPENYDGKYRGPMTLRDALAQSINIPAVKTFYLAGLADSLKTAREIGITTLTNPARYGLTLVLGGGEVTLLDMATAYSVFAAEGIKHEPAAILQVLDARGNILEEYRDDPKIVLSKKITDMISSILSDNKAKAPLYGPNSPIYFTDRSVASKTGTTNDYRDAWVLGYTPSLVVGAWAGNNDNSPMEKKTSGLIIVPLWSEFMRTILQNYETEWFPEPDKENSPETKPVIRGFWYGGENFFVDKISGKLATELTPDETRAEKVITEPHSILYWINKNDPLGPRPDNPYNDAQFSHWEVSVQKWLSGHGYNFPITTRDNMPKENDDVHVPDKMPQIEILEPKQDVIYDKDKPVNILIANKGIYPVKKVEVFVNGTYTGTINPPGLNLSFSFGDIEPRAQNELRLVVQDTVFNTTVIESSFETTPSL